LTLGANLFPQSSELRIPDGIPARLLSFLFDVRYKNPMILIISAVLAVIPLLGIVWILMNGTITTVDGLFMSLILLVMSGIFALSAALEFPRARRAAANRGAQGLRPATIGLAIADTGAAPLRGTVQSVQFFEAPVGQPNKSVIVISNGQGATRTLVLEGDLRNRLPAGKRMELVIGDENGRKKLLAAERA
jgi:hypothetical protein